MDLIIWLTVVSTIMDWGDSDEYNKLFSHIHYDNDDITHRSIGITMMYFQNINNQIQLKEQK